MSGGNRVVVEFEPTPGLYRAYDADDYDGAENGCTIEGWGRTEAEARAELALLYADGDA